MVKNTRQQKLIDNLFKVHEPHVTMQLSDLLCAVTADENELSYMLPDDCLEYALNTHHALSAIKKFEPDAVARKQIIMDLGHLGCDRSLIAHLSEQGYGHYMHVTHDMLADALQHDIDGNVRKQAAVELINSAINPDVINGMPETSRVPYVQKVQEALAQELHKDQQPEMLEFFGKELLYLTWNSRRLPCFEADDHAALVTKSAVVLNHYVRRNGDKNGNNIVPALYEFAMQKHDMAQTAYQGTYQGDYQGAHQGTYMSLSPGSAGPVAVRHK